jgi:Flagellar transcriptional activator (FlhC)
MRISDDRYSRDRLRLDIAIHFIRHEARTHTIRQWTGLTDDRIRKLYRSYLHDTGVQVVRHRGKSPQQASYFLRTVRLSQEAAVLASISCLLGVLRYSKGAPARLSPGIGRAAPLCQAYESYRALVTEPVITMEHAVLLLVTLSQGVELALQGCGGCGALLVADPLALQPPHCAICSMAKSRSAQRAPCNH